MIRLSKIISLWGLALAWQMGAGEAQAQSGPRVSIRTSSTARRAVDPARYLKAAYPWHKSITATVFWVGESSSARNPTPNHMSSWDINWAKNYGGFDNPNPKRRKGYRPAAFVPRQNPFYVALPYNDVQKYGKHKPEAARVIPWFKRENPKPGQTVCKGRWVQIVYRGKTCYAQWEDCGPWVTDDWRYVFGRARPKNRHNGGAGIDVSPAVRDYLGLKSGERVHWRFVEFGRVPRGAWSQYGTNNPFVNKSINPVLLARKRYVQLLQEKRDAVRTRAQGAR